MPSKRSTSFGLRAGWRQRVALTRYRRPRRQLAQKTYMKNTNLQDRIISGFVAGSSNQVCERSKEDHRRAPAREARRDAAMAHQKFFKMSAEIKQL